MKKFILLLIGGVSLLACEETVKLDLKNSEPALIIEGLVTNELKNQYVRITKSAGFYDTSGVTVISDAVVSVTDGEVTYTYEHNPDNNENNNGKYFSALPFAGQVGKTYSLLVEVGGNTYTASDVLYPVTSIDSLKVSFNQEEFNDPEKGREEYYYEILFYAHEPQETEDFYLFKFYRNDTLVYDSETDVYFSDDDLLGEEINGIPAASFYKLGDIGKVEMYSISNTGFIYYNDLINLLKNDGGMFGSPPVNPRTNIKGGAFGYFQTSSIVSESILIEK
jgi:hypothetical protein